MRVVTVFWLYVAAVALITVVPTRAHWRRHRPWWVVVQLVPFHVPPVGFVLNIVMFAPLGFLLPVLWPRLGSLLRVTGVAFLASLAIELTQLAEWVVLGNHRMADVNDLISNTAGGMLGWLVLRLARHAGFQARM